MDNAQIPRVFIVYLRWDRKSGSVLTSAAASIITMTHLSVIRSSHENRYMENVKATTANDKMGPDLPETNTVISRFEI